MVKLLLTPVWISWVKIGLAHVCALGVYFYLTAIVGVGICSDKKMSVLSTLENPHNQDTRLKSARLLLSNSLLTLLSHSANTKGFMIDSVAYAVLEFLPKDNRGI